MRHLGKKLIGWTLCLIMAAGMLPVMAREAKAYRDADFETGGIQYEIIDDDSVLVTGCNDELENVTIPSEVTYDNKPYTVCGIGPDAFYGCNYMHNVTIPGSVKEISEGAFYSCNNLTAITVAADNADYSSSEGVLFNIDQTKLICYPIRKGDLSYIIPDSVLEIESLAFAECANLTEVTIPNGVTVIKDDTFKGSGNLVSVNIPESVTTIGEDAFNCCSKLESIILPSSLTSIGNSAFDGCSSLTSIVLPNSLTSIGENAFKRCGELKTVWVSSDHTDIVNTEAFPGLTNIVTYSVDTTRFPTNLTYNGDSQDDAIKAYIKVIQGETSLQEGTAYQVKFRKTGDENAAWGDECIDAGTYQVKIVGAHIAAGYVGEATDANWTFEIKPFDLFTAIVDLSDLNLKYDGNDQRDSVKDALTNKLKGTGITFKDGDYTIEFSGDSGAIYSADTNVTDAGKYVVKIVGNGNNCKGKIVASFEIKPASLADDDVSLGNGNFIYDGDDQTSKVGSALRVEFVEQVLTQGMDYTISYYDNASQPVISVVDAGVYKVGIAGKGNFTGEIKKSFEIKPTYGLTVSLEDSTYEFDGTAKTIENSPVSNAIGGTTTYQYSFEEDGTYVEDLAALTQTKAGDYTVYVKATNPNYSNTATTTATLGIIAVEDEVIITIVGNTETITGDGKFHSVEGFTYSAKRGTQTVAASEFTVTLAEDKKAVASGTDAGTYDMGLTAEDFTVTSENYANIKVVYTDGKLTIEQPKEDSDDPKQSKGEYAAVGGAAPEFTLGSEEPLVFTFKRAADDETTFDHFTGILIDGKAVPEKDASGNANWTARRGSLVLELQPSYLNTLSAGEHNINVIFDDGEASAAFKVLEAKTSTDTTTTDDTQTTDNTRPTDNSPATGDTGMPVIWLALLFLSMAGMVVTTEKKRKQA